MPVARLGVLFTNEAHRGGGHQLNAQPPGFARLAMHVDRLVVELLRDIEVALRDRDVGKYEQRAAMLHGAAAGICRGSRLQGACDSLVVVTAFERGKTLKK